MRIVLFLFSPSGKETPAHGMRDLHEKPLRGCAFAPFLSCCVSLGYPTSSREESPESHNQVLTTDRINTRRLRSSVTSRVSSIPFPSRPLIFLFLHLALFALSIILFRRRGVARFSSRYTGSSRSKGPDAP